MSAMVPKRFEELIYWMQERQRMLKRKNDPRFKGDLSDDINLRCFRYCNVHREDDKVTKWVAENWRDPFSDLPDLWFWMLMARFFNLPSTLNVMGKPSKKWDPVKDRASIEELRAQNFVIFNPAYIISTNGQSGDKLGYIFNQVLEPAWARREEIRPRKGDTLFSFAVRLEKLNGLAGFMTGQVVADIKYVAPLSEASDWWDWAFSGPGSRRGMNRMIGADLGAKLREDQWHEHLVNLRTELQKYDKAKAGVLTKAGVLPIHLQDLQNCLCEFDKYQRLLNGEGRPKQVYRGGRK